MLSSYQSGFCSKRSTGTCLAEFLNNVYTNVDMGKACAGIFLDLSKAFDCVEHETLLYKLKCLGFKQCLVNWFGSYLKDRTQLTVVNNVCSSTGDVSCGVPQGSILGPMLFICYINDLERHLLYSTPSLFADDTALLVSGTMAEDVSYKLNIDLGIVSNYFAANKLQLNLSKTKSMFFHNGYKFRNDNALGIRHNGCHIEQVTCFKYLGVLLDPTLSFKDHVEYICKESKQKTGMLWCMHNFISEPLAYKLYSALIKPVYTYCDYIYDRCSKTLARKIEVVHNSALKAVKSIRGRYSATELHEELKVPWLDVSRKNSTCTEVFKLLEGQGPPNLRDKFKVRDVGRSLRSAHQRALVRPKTRTKFGDGDFVRRGICYWECLPDACKGVETADQFKQNIKLNYYFEHVP